MSDTDDPKVYRTHLDDIDRDALLVMYADGEMELATRPGSEQQWITWGVPSRLVRMGGHR